MPDQSDPIYRLRRNLNLVFGALRRYALIIAAITVLTALFAAYIGHSATKASSTAQLVLTPHPLRQNYDVELSVENFSDDDGALARMFAFPMEPKTVSLVCMSDAVLSATLEQLKSEARLAGPIGSLNGLRGSLHVETNLDIETIEEIKYSPVLLLIATAKNPADARVLANTWAAQCVEGVRQYQNAKQQPHEVAFHKEVGRIQERLDAAEKRLDAFLAGREADAPDEEQRPIQTEERKLRREADVLAEVYKDAASKYEYIRLAGALDTPQVNLLFEGAEWGPPGSRKAVVFALLGAFWGFLAAAFLFAGVTLLMTPPENET